MGGKKKAVLMGPFVGELYWEGGRFAPMLPYMRNKQYRGRDDITYIILTRKERFDLYGKFADILVPLNIPGDYQTRSPNCFKLNGLKKFEYLEIVEKFKKKYSGRFKIIKHIYPDVNKGVYDNKNQFPRSQMRYVYAPRDENYKLVHDYLPNVKPWVVLSPRFRKGFKRNWKHWQKFYDLLWSKKDLLKEYTFIICGKKGEYRPDNQGRFYDMNNIVLGENSSLVGILLVILENTYFTFGSQSAIPNFSLLYGVEVFEFGCQRMLHTKTYNVKNAPITFIENRRYDLDPKEALTKLEKLLRRKKKNGKPMVTPKQQTSAVNKKTTY